MKTYKYFILLLFFLVSLNACEKEKQEYPGSLIKHIVNIEIPGSDMENRFARIYAYSENGHDNDLSALPEGDWTYELWIKVASDALIGGRNVRNGYYAGGACIGSREHNFELYLINDPDADFAIKYGKLNSRGTQIASMQSDGATENLHFDEWVHVAISRSSTDGLAKFYINGKLIDSSNDPIWTQTVSDEWLTFNYMRRNGLHKHFFKGGMDNIRVSTINRYPTDFTPNRKDIFKVDENTLLQLDLQEHLTSYDPPTNYKKIETKGTYDYLIAVHKDNTWHHDPDEYLPLGDYKNN